MENNKDVGYYEEIINGSQIVRARTIRLIRSWEFPRSNEALETLHNEFVKALFPGIYILRETVANKVYIGQSQDIYQRLTKHSNSPEDKMKKWDMVLVINDGRNSAQSDFNDNVIRLALEIYLIKLFKLNKYEVVSQGNEQILNGQQKSIFNSLLVELNFFLQKKGLITKFGEKKYEEEVLLDTLRKILDKKNYSIINWTTYTFEANGQSYFIRAGSKKSKGWQVTFRDKFKKQLKEGKGFLVVPRGAVPVIPFEKILELFDDETLSSENNTIDIFVEFSEEGAINLVFKQKKIDISEYALQK